MSERNAIFKDEKPQFFFMEWKEGGKVCHKFFQGINYIQRAVYCKNKNQKYDNGTFVAECGITEQMENSE